MTLAQRPITILIAALGGEGGGVLADWIIAAAMAEDYPVQSTSIPGVAQRTGATTYYVEIYPVRSAELGGRRPVMTLAPSPCDVDVMLASEWLETGRALANGYVTPERTTLIASTHRIYTVLEKMQMGDGRYDSERILRTARAASKHAVLADFQALALNSGTLINAVLFGALAGSGALPLTRTACENAIRSGGRGAEASLRGFAAGFAAASGSDAAPTAASPAAPRAGRSTQSPAPQQRLHSNFPAATHTILEEGLARVLDFQDEKYAELYLDRLDAIAGLDRQTAGEASGHKLTIETGRFLALWMSYEDVIRVADLKSRRSRFERVRAEVQAKAHEPLHIVEYLNPGVEELAALLPPALSKRLVAWTDKRGLTHKLNVGLYVRSSSVSGFRCAGSARATPKNKS
ncbi:MAG: indolepyruvate oxidoreductase subunit beta family protein [Proteobacteria bacterium]|nr:indolepyruvate oxidoreductase subunit beta family protein [Pseudomonadota bacterium]